MISESLLAAAIVVKADQFTYREKLRALRGVECSSLAIFLMLNNLLNAR
jgi:hypothetical protein